ncbi:glycosyltransferase, partial [Ochrobactrum sp. S1502_03]
PTIGFPTSIIYYERQNREYGETKYTIRKMLGLAINGITSFSVTPLRLVTVLGLGVSAAAFVAAFWVVFVKVFYFGHAVPGWASTVIPILFLGGIQLLCLGIIGEYIGKIYLEVKRRPRFIIDRIHNAK